MTTANIDLGKIRFKWQGTWNSATAYTRDDCVQYAGQAFVCVVDTESTSTNVTPIVGSTDWELMAAGGDPAATMTTPGDLLVRGASGLERLPIGTSGQSLLVNNAANGFTYGSPPRLKHRRFELTLQSGMTYSDVTPTLSYDLSTNGNFPTGTTVIGVYVGVWYSHGGSSNHGYLYGRFRQSGDTSGYYTQYNSHKYSDYYNSDWWTDVVNWDPNGSTTLEFQVTSSYNTSSSNTYAIYLTGYQLWEA